MVVEVCLFDFIVHPDCRRLKTQSTSSCRDIPELNWNLVPEVEKELF